MNRPAIEQLEGLDEGIAGLLAHAIDGWRTVKQETLELLVHARKNRSELAAQNERRLDLWMEPVQKVVRWVGVGARVAYHGIRGDYEDMLQISDVAITNVTDAEATVTWKTSRPTHGKVNWGDSISYGEEVVIDAVTNEHRATLLPLRPNTKYYFEILATDTDGKQTFDAYYGFTTKTQ